LVDLIDRRSIDQNDQNDPVIGQSIDPLIHSPYPSSLLPSSTHQPTTQLLPDLSPAFDWNIKQLFVFLVVEYESKKNVRGDGV
jgi:hypothetical protein